MQWSFLCCFLACALTVFRSTSTLFLSLSSTNYFEESSWTFCSEAPKALKVSACILALASALLQALFTRSSTAKTSWMAYTETTNNCVTGYKKERKSKKGRSYLRSSKNECRLTKAKSLFREKKRLGCLIFLRASISLGSKGGCSKASAR